MTTRTMSWVLAAALIASCGGSGPRPDGGDARKDANDSRTAGDTPGDAQGEGAVDQASADRGGGYDAGDAPADAVSLDAASLDAADAASMDAADADAGGDGDVAEAGNRGAQLVGHWTFSTGSEMVTCAAGSNETKNLAGDYVDVTRQDPSTLIASYFCNWKLDVGPADDSATVRPDQSCTSAVMVGMKYTWTAASFTISSADGHAGTLSANITVVIDNPQMPDTCSLVITATLQK